MGEDTSFQPQSLSVGLEHAGKRLDQFLSQQLPRHSRQRLQAAIKAGDVTVDGQPRKASFRLSEGTTVEIRAMPSPPEGPQPEDVPLHILFEDEDLAVINKPPGMVVHPSKGHWSGTLVAAAAHHFQTLSQIAGRVRPGVVHRLDRDTSGAIVLAKHDTAHLALAKQFQDRTVEKVYWAAVSGCPQLDRDRIDRPIGPHPHIREQMAIREGHPQSKTAQTFYEVQRRYARFSELLAFPKTGRTHQIRVHLASIGHPILCDRLYGGRSAVTEGEINGNAPSGATLLTRQALHAWRLAIRLPSSGEQRTFEAPLPADLRLLQSCLKLGD